MLTRFASFYRNTLRRFIDARGGNFAMILGLLLVPLLIGAGMAIDLGRSSQVRTVFQEAADAALLRAAQLRMREPNLSDAELTAAAEAVFRAATATVTGVNVKDFAVSFDPKTKEFNLNITSNLDTSLMGVAGVKTIPISTLAAVVLGDPPYLEVVLALDNTGSMVKPPKKLEDLKESATELVEAVFQQPNAGVMVGLVPFAQYVNVGDKHADEFWISISGKAEKNKGQGSRSIRSWKGCVGSRSYPANIEDSDYAANPVPGLDDVSCPNALLPMSTDKQAMLSAIKGMKATGPTYIPSGLVWAWRLLTPTEPFSEGLTFEELEKVRGVKSIVLLTDGENTASPEYPTHEGRNQSLADDLMIRLCDAVKKDDIVIYTIAFDVSDATIRGLLEDCATTPGHYFDADNAAALSAAFSNIASSLRSLSLSK